MQNSAMTARETVEYFSVKYFCDRDFDAALECLSDDVRWLGAADSDKLIINKDGFKEVFFSNVVDITEPLSLTNELLDERSLAPDITQILMSQKLRRARGNSLIFEQRCEFICRRENGIHKICGIHGSVFFDWKKQAQANRKIKKSELELKNVANAVPGGLITYKLTAPNEARITYFTDGVPELLGYSRNEYKALLERSPMGNVCADDFERYSSALIESLISGKNADMTFRSVHKDGTLVWVTLAMQTEQNSSGELLGHGVLMGTSKEFNLFRSILDEYTNAIYVVDAETFEMYYSNNSMRELLRFSEKDVQGKKCYEVLFGRDTPCESCGICSGRPLLEDERTLPKFGNKVVLITERFINWMDRPAMIRYAKDITERRAASEVLHKEQDRYRIMVENTGTVVFDWDLENGTTYTSGDYNRFVLSRQPVNDIIENRISIAAVHPDDLPLLQQFGRDTKAGRAFVETTLRARMCDGSYLWTTISVNNICDETGKRVRVIGAMRDVNDVQLAALDRQLSLRRLDTVIEDTNILYWEYDINEHSAVLGKTTQEQCGLEEVIENYPQPLYDTGFIPADYQTQYNWLLKEAEKGSEYAEAKLPMVLKDGKWHWQLVRYHTLFDSNGQPSRAIGTAIDITAQVEAERKYKGIVAMQDALASHANDFFVFNLTQNRVESARTSVRDTDEYEGMSYDYFIAYSSNHMIGTEYSTEYAMRFNRQRLLAGFNAGKNTVNCTVRYASEDGTAKWMELNMSLVENPGSGNIIAFFYSNDITRQKMEQEVIEAVSAYDFDIIALTDLDSEQITMFKKRDECFGHLSYNGFVDFDSTIRLSAESNVYPEDKELFLKCNSIDNIRERLREKEFYEFTFRCYDENGAVRLKKSRYADYRMTGGLVLLTSIDVTDVVAAQERQKSALQAALDSARQANSAKTAFLSSMSHDIRTPLNVIAGMTELAIGEPDNVEQVRESLSTIRDASGHLLSLVNNILEMSRIESGKVVTAEERFSQSGILNKLAQMSAPLIKEKDQKLELEVDVTHDRCIGDALRLTRILENLISNAVKFTPKGGCIKVSCQESESKHGTELQRYIYTVTDTGIGIQPDQLENIFEPFFRTGTASTTGIEGTGLGLSIVKSTLELMGGTIDVHSDTEVGSSFVVEIPFRVAEKGIEQHESMPEQKRLSTDFSGLNILLVEDHPINALVATRILERGGARVTFAHNGLEGFETFRDSEENEFDIVLMDIQMPVMNGYEASMAIRECSHPRAKTIPIVAMSADAFAEDVKKALSSGMNDHISKPIEISRLAEVLTNLDRFEKR